MKKGLIAILIVALVLVLTFVLWPSKKNVVDTPFTKKEKPDSRNIEIIQGLKTCEICGYNALEDKGTACQNCGYTLNQEALKQEGLSSIQELIMIRQIDYFMPDTLGTPIDFMAPVVSKKGYPKNPNWHPKIYESQIYEIQRAMIEARQQVPDSTAATSNESASQHN